MHTWSRDVFKGWGKRKLLSCAELEESDTPDAEANREGVPDIEYVLIPDVDLPAAFVDGGWKNTALGRCSVYVDGDKNGFNVYGDGAGAADSSIRVVAGSTVLFGHVRFREPV